MNKPSQIDKPLPHGCDTEQRLLDFVEELILDVAHTHSRVTEAEVALWIARVAVGANNK